MADSSPEITPLSRAQPAVDKEGKPTQRFQQLTEQVAQLPPLFGTGSPENVIESGKGRLYVDTSGAAGSKVYMKIFDQLSNDPKQGWELV